MLVSTPQLPPEIPKITIFVHGTDLVPKTPVKPLETLIRHKQGMYPLKEITEKYKYTKVLRNICRDNSEEFPKEHAHLFCWSGLLQHEARFDAAQKLNAGINTIIKKYKKYHLTVITHSHGGNVVLNLANIDDKKAYTVHRLILMAIPVQDKTKKSVSHSFFANTTIYCPYSTGDMVQVLDPQGAKTQGREYRKIFSQDDNLAVQETTPLKEQTPLFSKRKFDDKKVKHIKVTSKHRPIFHVEFLLPPFTRSLSSLLKQALEHDFSTKDLHFKY